MDNCEYIKAEVFVMKKSERAERFISREGDFTLIRRRGQKFIKGLKRQKAVTDLPLCLRNGRVALQKKHRKKKTIFICGVVGTASIIGSILFIKKILKSIHAMISE